MNLIFIVPEHSAADYFVVFGFKGVYELRFKLSRIALLELEQQLPRSLCYDLLRISQSLDDSSDQFGSLRRNLVDNAWLKRDQGRDDKHRVLSCPCLLTLEACVHKMQEYEFQFLRDLHICSNTLVSRLPNSSLQRVDGGAAYLGVA